MYRLISAELKYSSPRSIVNEMGNEYRELNISALTAMAVRSCISTTYNFKAKAIFLDQSPIVYYAYYSYWIRKIQEEENRLCFPLKVINKQVESFSNSVKLYIYFPTGKINLVSDGMRPTENEFQIQIDIEIRKLLDQFSIENSKIYEVQKETIQERKNEIADLISRLN